MSCDYEAQYDGRIWSNKTNRFLQPASNGKGYQRVVLMIDGKKFSTYVHRFIAENLIPNPENLPEINHKNGDKSDNSVGNLEWVSSSDNKIHAINTGLRKVNGIIQMKKNCDYFYIWASAKEAEEFTGVNSKNIQRVCRGERKTAGGYIWEYLS